MNDEVLTPKEAAKIAERSPMTVRRWMYDGWLPYEKNKLTRRITVKRSDVEKLLQEGPPREEAEPA